MIKLKISTTLITDHKKSDLEIFHKLSFKTIYIEYLKSLACIAHHNTKISSIINITQFEIKTNAMLKGHA